MTAAAIFAVLWPLARRAPLRAGSDVAVYRDQLDEIERDRAAGLIGEREAEAARIEVSRRLLAAADAVPPAAPRAARPGAGGRRRSPRWSCCRSARPGLYLMLGSPQSAGPAARGAARRAAGAALDRGTGRPGRGASGAKSGGRPRLGGARAGLYAARALRRCREGAPQCAAASRPNRRARGRSRRGADRRGQRRRHRRGQGRRSSAPSRSIRATSGRAISSGSPPSRTAARRRRPRSGGRCWRRRRRTRHGPASCVNRWRASIRAAAAAAAAGTERRRCRGGKRNVARAARRRWCGAWWSGLRNGSSRTAPMSRAGCGWCAPIWCWATRNRRARPRATRAARSRAIRTSCGRVDELVKGLGLEG